MRIAIDVESLEKTELRLRERSADLADGALASHAEVSSVPGAEKFDAAFTTWVAGSTAMAQELSERMSRHADGLSRTASEFAALEDGLLEDLGHLHRAVIS